MSAMVFERSGKGFPLVFVHGYLAGAEIWRNQINYFKDRFEVFAPNLPGFGASSELEAPSTIGGFAQKILNDLMQLGVTQFHLVGHSMGGMIVQAMTTLAPDRIHHLVCYGTGPMGVLPDRFETIDQSRERLKRDGLAATAESIAATWFIKGDKTDGFSLCAELGRQASMQAAMASLSAWETWDGRAELSNINSRTLIIWGDRDRSYGWSQPEALWQGIRNSSLAVIPDCAHNVHLEKPELFNMIVGDFLPTDP